MWPHLDRTVLLPDAGPEILQCRGDRPDYSMHAIGEVGRKVRVCIVADKCEVRRRPPTYAGGLQRHINGRGGVRTRLALQRLTDGRGTGTYVEAARRQIQLDLEIRGSVDHPGRQSIQRWAKAGVPPMLAFPAIRLGPGAGDACVCMHGQPSRIEFARIEGGKPSVRHECARDTLRHRSAIGS